MVGSFESQVLSQAKRFETLGAGSAKEAHFGLGQATEAARIVVRWPSGVEQTVSHVHADRRIVLAETGHSR